MSEYTARTCATLDPWPTPKQLQMHAMIKRERRRKNRAARRARKKNRV